MADQITGTVGSTTGTPLSSITGGLQGSLTNLISSGQNYLDRIIPPQAREEMKSKMSQFATEKPVFASFLLSQIALSGLPLALFFILVIAVGIFAVIAGILIGLVGALFFILLAVGFALVVLLPTLFVTTFFAVAIWLWGVGAYYIIKWFNEKKVPGIHVPLGEGLREQTGLKNLPMLSGTTRVKETNGHGEDGAAEKPHKAHKGGENGSTDVRERKHDRPAAAESHEGHPREKHVKKKEAQSSIPADPHQAVGDATSAVSGVGKSVLG